MKNILFLIIALGSFVTASAQEKNKNAKFTIDVSGNCGQCKKRIEKAAFSVDGVKSAVWSEEDGKLSLILNEEKTSVLDVEKAVAKVGHDTPSVRATDKDYEDLHSCCKYVRK